MSKTPTPEEFENLKGQLKELKDQLKQQHNQRFPSPPYQQANPDMEFLSKLMEEGGVLVKEWNHGVIEARKYESDNFKEVELQRISAANTISKRENNAKVLLVTSSLIILAVLMYLNKSSEGILTLVAVIITAVLQKNLTDFFKNITDSFSSKNE